MQAEAVPSGLGREAVLEDFGQVLHLDARTGVRELEYESLAGLVATGGEAQLARG